MIGQTATLEGMREVSSAPGVIVARGAISASAQTAAAKAFGDLDEILPPSLTRRAAAGPCDLERLRERFPRAVGIEPVSETSGRLVRDDGHVYRQVVSNPVRSYVGGWRWDRFKAEPAPGIVSSRLPERMRAAQPFFDEVDRAYSEAAPAEWSAQRKAARQTIGATAFTTAAINIDYASHYHRDVGDYPDGLSTVTPTAVGGDYSGGELVFPELRCFVDLAPGDLCLFRAHELLHGNTPVRGPGRRLSVVSYARRQLCSPSLPLARKGVG